MLVAAGAVLVVGVVARILVLAGVDGRLGGDEAYAGLQAFDILGGDLPVVINGAVYTAVFESYLFAPVTAFTGGSIAALKVLFVLVWAAASVVTGLLAARSHGRIAGLVAGGFVWIAPGALLTVSTLAYPGYALGMGTSALCALLASRVADDDGGTDWRAPAVLGLVAGLTFWIHPMFLATVVPVLGVVVVARRAQWRRVLPPIAIGGLVGCSPFLVWNAVNGWPSVNDRAEFDGTYTDRLDAIVTDLLPRALGFKDGLLAWRNGSVVGWLSYAVVVASVVAGAVVIWRASRSPSRWIVPVVLALVVPLMAALPPLIFALDGRYAVIPLPFVAVAIGALVTRLVADHRAAVRYGLTGGLAMVWAALLVGPAFTDAIDTRDQDPNASYRAVVARLDAAGIDRLNGSFWQVLPIDYVADDDLETAVLPYYSIRFPAEQRAVEAAMATEPRTVAFVFSLFDEDTQFLPMPADRYTREQIGDVILYLPLATG